METKKIKELKVKVYTFNGKHGVLINDPESNATQFVPVENIDFQKKLDIVELTSVADFAEDGEEITDKPIVNPENEQRLIVDGVWSTIKYQQSDEYVRELLVTTNQYYNWISCRQKMLEKISLSTKKEWQHLKKEWEEICSQYSDPCGFAEFEENSVEFDNLLSESGLI